MSHLLVSVVLRGRSTRDLHTDPPAFIMRAPTMHVIPRATASQ